WQEQRSRERKSLRFDGDFFGGESSIRRSRVIYLTLFHLGGENRFERWNKTGILLANCRKVLERYREYRDSSFGIDPGHQAASRDVDAVTNKGGKGGGSSDPGPLYFVAAKALDPARQIWEDFDLLALFPRWIEASEKKLSHAEDVPAEKRGSFRKRQI